MMKPRQLMLPADMHAAILDVAAGLPDRAEWSAAARLLLREALSARGYQFGPVTAPPVKAQAHAPAIAASPPGDSWTQRTQAGPRLKGK